MNNSELSMEIPSADTFSTPQTHVCPPSWSDCSDEQVQMHSQFNTECESNGMFEIDSVGAATNHIVRDMQPVGNRSNAETVQPDRGVWLLYGSPTRHSHWEHLKGVLQEGVAAHEFARKDSADLVKRSFDVVGAILLSIAMLPLFLSIAILIKLDSSGPVFFRHNRVGRGGKCFVLWKFRSMRTEVPQYEASPQSSQDARLTRVGRLIRRLSLDEMPQLINVLRGEMSLVGPRPEMSFLVDRYHPNGCQRLVVRPGITGLWQISPARAFPIHENLQYDLHYIRNRNFFLDCAIIVRTITAVIHGVGAV